MTQLINILLLSSLGSLAGLIGAVIFLIWKEFSSYLCKYAVPFAAGVLLSVSLLHLFPESVHELKEKAFLYVLVTILFSFFFEQFLAHLHHHQDHKNQTNISLKSSVPLVIFGDTIHNFIDGVSIGAAYLTNPSFGLIVALATFLHETPHEIGDFGILLSAGWTKRKTFIANFLSALFTFPGAISVIYIFKNSQQSIAVLLAISAGMFLYLGASDLLPMLAKEENVTDSWKKFIFLIAGVLIMYFLTYFTPEHFHT